MSRSPVLYVVKGFHPKGKIWLSILDQEGKPVVFTGVPAKAQAITFAQTLAKMPTYDALQIIRQHGKRSTKVWDWKREA